MKFLKIIATGLAFSFIFSACTPKNNTSSSQISSTEESQTDMASDFSFPEDEDSSTYTSQSTPTSSTPSEIASENSTSSTASATNKADMQQIDLSTVSGEKITWGVGVNVDAENRPVDVARLQADYGELGAYFIAPVSEKIYLTFDEGYENGYTPAILDALKNANVPAVFFVTMDFAKKNPDLIRRMIDEGHILGNHSVHHKDMTTLSDTDATEEILGLHRYIVENYKYEMWLFRPPEGAFSEKSLALAHNAGYLSVFWSFAYKDWLVDEQPDLNYALENAVKKNHGGSVYLLHAVSKTNAEMLPDFIAQSQAKGYIFSAFPAFL